MGAFALIIRIMWADVVDLRDFYETEMGQVAHRMVSRGLRQLWPDLTGKSLVGLGFAPPYLTPFVGEAERVAAFMPAQQGVLHWPADAPGGACLVEETALPLPDASVDRLLLVHGLESSEALRAMMEEIWRVLAGDGRLLVVTPNRRGLWSRSDRSPFGWGQPYGLQQLNGLLRGYGFVPTASARVLYIPPVRSGKLLLSAETWENLGARWFTRFSGVVLAEARKQVWAPSSLRSTRSRRPVVVPVPNPAPLRRSRGV